MATADQWRVVGERCSEAVVALARVRALMESNRRFVSEVHRAAQSTSLDVPDLPSGEDVPGADNHYELLARTLWGCGHAWFRASREVKDLAAPRISPALAASFDEDAVGINTLIGARIADGPQRMGKHTAEVLRAAMTAARPAIRVLRAMEDPVLDVVADDLASVVRDIAGAPPPD
jgi:hypothetical protein